MLFRWGCTPLQEAVRSGRNLLAELIRTKGGTLPADVGAVQICSAAGKGDVPALRLLHLCGVKSDVGDYDHRCPLHLAAAEARLLAVSFLLVISANPNCTGEDFAQPKQRSMISANTNIAFFF
jgi:potassium channel